MATQDILFANAAIQNRGYDLEEKPGKIAGLLAADLLNTLAGSPVLVHTWNNVGIFDETEPCTAEERLAAKYSSPTMRSHLEYMQAGANLQVITDDNEAFGRWALRLVDRLLDAGIVYIEDTDFHACADCGLVIAETAVAVNECGKCGSHEITETHEPGMFVDVAEDRQQLLPPDRVFNSMNLRNERDSMKQIPPRLLLSRPRSRGVGLDVFGLPERVLDPRLGIGLLALYAADMQGYQNGCLVQSASTLIRTVPYLNAVVRDPDQLQVPKPAFAVHTMIDQSLLEDGSLTSLERNVLLPIASLRRKNTVTANDLEALRRERAKVMMNASAIETILTRLGIDTEVGNLPVVVGQTLESGRLNDLLPTIAKSLGQTIELCKRATPETLSEALRDNARAANELVRYSQALLG